MAAHKETLVATRHTRRDIGSRRARTSIRTVAALFGVYSTFYLTVAGVAHFLTSPEAVAAIVPTRMTAPAAEAPGSTETIAATSGSSATEVRSAKTTAIDTSRECGLATAIDSGCIFN